MDRDRLVSLAKFAAIAFCNLLWLSVFYHDPHLTNSDISIVVVLLGVSSIFLYQALSKSTWPPSPSQGVQKPPVSVNYHFTRQCNFACGFCFHTAKTSHVEPLPNAKKGLALLKHAGMKKINFAGGEPFLEPHFLGELAQYCKEVLHLESVSVVTNGSKVTERWLQKYAQYLDIMAVSCDSFDEPTNIKIGRGTGGHVAQLTKLSRWCRQYNVKFKINTVVNRYNFSEDMNAQIQALAPFRWKCFQVLVIKDENDSSDTLRDARRFTISNEEFKEFCDRHRHNGCFVEEGNDVMRSSYLLLDEYMRFLNKDVKEPTKSILDVGVTAALRDVYWDEKGFEQRGGVYDWSKDEKPEHPGSKELEW